MTAQCEKKCHRKLMLYDFQSICLWNTPTVPPSVARRLRRKDSVPDFRAPGGSFYGPHPPNLGRRLNAGHQGQPRTKNKSSDDVRTNKRRWMKETDGRGISGIGR